MSTDAIFSTTNIFQQMSLRIIKEQELIIGPMAWDEARKVPGFTIVDSKKGEISIDGDKKEILNKLVFQYEKIFGRASHEACREAVEDLIKELPVSERPSSLI